jgi:NAD(P)-dependent dehydrogenase (short-subunit alcohol dehydrogenase family)
MSTESVVVAGVGPGLGFHIALRFADIGLKVAMLARNEAKLRTLAGNRADLIPYPCDLTQPEAVTTAFERVEAELGPIACAVFNAGAYRPGGLLEIAPQDFEQCWRVGAFAGFLVVQQAAKLMVPRAHGTILITGATASVRGGARFANLAAPKFALRAIAQSAARELGPKGIHVAHIIIDGQVRGPRYDSPVADRGPDAMLEPARVAEVYAHLHAQPRSAWTQELDLRPWSEKF